jgi:hypothetical protein
MLGFHGPAMLCSMEYRRRAQPYAVALGILWGIPLGAATLAWATAPKHNIDGRCEGLGFGCTLAPADAVLFAGIVIGPFLFVAGLIVCAVIAFVRARRMRPDSAHTSRPAGSSGL